MATVYEQMKALSKPRYVAIIGASANPVQITPLITNFDQTQDKEINPLVVYDRGKCSVALDARILISAPEDKDR